MDRATDLSDQPWVDRVPDFAKQPMERDGKIYGMPMAIEGHGIIYNKDLFARAGITEPPVTLTELEDAFKKLKDAGIQPISNGFSTKWIINQTMMNATALRDDPIQFSKDVTAGKLKIAEDPLFQKYIKFLDLVLKYSNPNPLTTDYNTQVTLFASGQAAMMTQGNWTQVQIDKINPDLNIGLIGIPIGDAPSESGFITSGVPRNWIVNSKGAHPEEAKAFLDWMVSSDTGKRFLINEFKFIPALDGIEFEKGALGDIADSILEYVKDGKAKSWDNEFPQTYGAEWAASLQEYAAGRINSDQLLQQLDEAIQKLAKK
jgi:raffinose/stachyose/melibiose transport system substrate-binding protein